MKKYNIVVAALSVLLGLAIRWFSRNLTSFDEIGIPGEAFWPQSIAWLLVALGILQAIQTSVAGGVGSVDLHSPAVRTAYIGALLAFGYAVVMTFFGFIPATVLFIPLLMLLMGARNPVTIGLATVAVVVVVWLFFVQVFNTTLPPSTFFD
jgi:ABC-type polysaccharide/polyol phosphate export permease